MKVRNTMGILSPASIEAIAIYVQRVSDYIQTALSDVADVSDAATMAQNVMDGATAAGVRSAVYECHKYTHSLQAVVEVLQGLMSSLYLHAQDDDPRRPQLYKDAVLKAAAVTAASKVYITDLEALRDTARENIVNSNGRGITSASLAAIARADNAHSHILLACSAARQLLIDRHELEPYRPKL